MLRKIARKGKGVVGHILRWTRKHLFSRPRLYCSVHPKKLALCITKGFQFKLDLTAIAQQCGVVEYDSRTEAWFALGKETTLEAIRSEFEYLWFIPETYAVTKEMVYGLILKFCKSKVDFVLLSWTVKDAPLISVLPEPYANVVLSSDIVDGWKNAHFSSTYGQMMRLFCIAEDCFGVMKIESFFAEHLSVYEDPYYNHREVIFAGGTRRNLQRKAKFEPKIETASSKPLILILPAFLMVGGVEKNTLGVIENLVDRYQFMMIVSDGLMEKNGSMHYQMRRYISALYDFSEILDYSQYLDAFADLRDAYKPNAVWICNGSEWICDNAMKLRHVFSQIPIIDQEAYDFKEGWITRYHDKGIRSYDRFIAVNQKIYDRFTNEFRIAPEKIDIIYSVVSKNILTSGKQYDPIEMKNKYRIPSDKNIFAFIGRLTAQKRPSLLVRLFDEINKLDDSNHFMIIGNGELNAEVKSQISQMNLQNVTMVDFVDDLGEIYCFLSGILFVSAYEGLPIVILEGLMKGVPVLSTDVGDVKLVVDEYKAGMIFQNGLSEDPAGMAKDFLLFSKALDSYRISIAEHTEDLQKRFSAPSVARQWDASFQNAIHPYSAPFTS